MGILVTVLVLVIAAILLGIVFYKKERRYLIQFALLAYIVTKWILFIRDKLLNILKNRSSEPVKYEKVCNPPPLWKIKRGAYCSF